MEKCSFFQIWIHFFCKKIKKTLTLFPLFCTILTYSATGCNNGCTKGERNIKSDVYNEKGRWIYAVRK